MSFVIDNSDTEFCLSFYAGKTLVPKAVSAHVAQSVERVLGKDEVTSSTLVVGSRK